MEKIVIWNKETCATCRDLQQLLKKNKTSVCNFNYLEEKIDRKELKRVVKLLKCKPFDLVRQKEKIYHDNFEGKTFTNEEWIDILIENPILIQRPIIIQGNKALIGRPVERVFEIIEESH